MTKQRIGFIGLGNMGSGMACRLAEAGYELAVYNRTQSKAQEVAGLGARVAQSPADAASGADVVMLSLADQNAVTSVLDGADGVFGSLRAGGYIVDMSTVPPEFARELGPRAEQAGYHALDACVYGAPQHARSGELRVLVGGEEDDFHAVEEVLDTLGKQLAYLGAKGTGATMKLVLNMLMGVQIPALAEAIVYGERAGLPREKILEMIAGSGYSSPVMTFRCGMMGRRSFEQAAFRLSLMRKDMMLVLAESHELGVPLPVAESAYAMLTAAKQQGLGDLDVAAMLPFMERMAGIAEYEWPGSLIDRGPRPRSSVSGSSPRPPRT